MTGIPGNLTAGLFASTADDVDTNLFITGCLYIFLKPGGISAIRPM